MFNLSTTNLNQRGRVVICFTRFTSYMNLPSPLLHTGCMGTRRVSQFYHSNSLECCNYPLLHPCPTPGPQFTGWLSPLISCSWVATITIMQIFLSRYPGSNFLLNLSSLRTSLDIFRINNLFDSFSKCYSMFQTLI